MDSSKIEISGGQAKRFFIGMVIAVIISAICTMNVTKHSNIRNVDMIAILGFGATIGIFIISLRLLFKVKKQKNPTGTGY